MNKEDLLIIGDALRKSREEKELSLKQVSEQTHIRVEYVEALELGNVSKIKSPTYIVGYLKKYSKFLELDLEEEINKLSAITAVLHSGASKNLITGREFLPAKWLIVFSLLVCLLLSIVFGLYY